MANVTDDFSGYPICAELGAPKFATDIKRLGDNLLSPVMDSTAVSIALYRSTDGGTSYSVLSTPYSSASSRTHPYIDTDGSSKVYLACKHSSGTGAYFKKSTDSGASWGSEVTIASSLTGVTDTAILYVSSSLLLCAFRVSSGTDYIIRVYSSIDDGANWSLLASPVTVAQASASSLEDLSILKLGSGTILLGYEQEITENAHAICKLVHSTDNGSTWGSPVTVYDDASNRADNEGGCFVVSPAGVLEYWFGTDEDDRTGTGTTPSYDRIKIKRVTSADEGLTWGNKTTMYDSYGMIEPNVVYNASSQAILTGTRFYWSSGGVTTQWQATIAKDVLSTFASGGWSQDGGIAYVVSVGGTPYLRVDGNERSSERAFFVNSSTIANGSFQCVMRMAGSANRDGRVFFRYTDANNHYMVVMASATSTVKLFKRVSGTYTELASASQTASANTDYTVRVNFSGTSIAVLVDGVSKISTTDATYSTGKIGVGATTIASSLPTLFRAISGVDSAVPPGVPGSVAVLAGNTIAKASWSASVGGEVTGYQYRIDGGTATGAGLVLFKWLDSLTNGTSYTFEVRAYDAVPNYSAWSDAVTFTPVAGNIFVID